jgi:hypothetical protein
LANVVVFPGPASEPQPKNALRAERLKTDQIGKEDAPLGEILSYWRSLRTEGKIPPPRRSLDVLKLGRVMGWTHVLDCTDEAPEAFWFRLYGSRISIFRQKDFTKFHLADVPCPLYRQSIVADYNTVKLSGCPSFHKIKTRLDWTTHSYTRLVLPLADDQRRVTQLLISVNARPLPELGDLPW